MVSAIKNTYGDKMASPKSIAVAKNAGETNKTKSSLVKCEVKTNLDEWISPESCQVFYIDEDAKFPEINFEIKTDEPGPYYWEWLVRWRGLACQQKTGKLRFTPQGGALPEFIEKGKFESNETRWKANLNNQVIGGNLIVKVKTNKTVFIKKITIKGKNPDKARVQKYIEENWEDQKNKSIAKKAFQQETSYSHFYSDNEPLVSFDNGYGIGQITNPKPSYSEAWNWKDHIKTVMNKFIPDKRNKAKSYLSSKGINSYTEDQYDVETLAFYNGAGRFHKWNEETKKWEENPDHICDPDSNKTWLKNEFPSLSSEELKKSNEKPKYTGHCYAKHIIKSQGGI